MVQRSMVEYRWKQISFKSDCGPTLLVGVYEFRNVGDVILIVCLHVFFFHLLATAFAYIVAIMPKKPLKQAEYIPLS